jgi:hypothetical protein
MLGGVGPVGGLVPLCPMLGGAFVGVVGGLAPAGVAPGRIGIAIVLEGGALSRSDNGPDLGGSDD